MLAGLHFEVVSHSEVFLEFSGVRPTLVDLVAKELLASALEWAELKEMEEEGGDLALTFYT